MSTETGKVERTESVTHHWAKYEIPSAKPTQIAEFSRHIRLTSFYLTCKLSGARPSSEFNSRRQSWVSLKKSWKGTFRTFPVAWVEWRKSNQHTNTDIMCRVLLVFAAAVRRAQVKCLYFISTILCRNQIVEKQV